jgi:hypothetical protein
MRLSIPVLPLIALVVGLLLVTVALLASVPSAHPGAAPHVSAVLADNPFGGGSSGGGGASGSW